MPDNSDDHFLILIWRLVTRHDNFCACQVLQLVHLGRQKAVSKASPQSHAKAYTWAVEEGLGIQGEGLSIRGVKEAGRLKFQKAD